MAQWRPDDDVLLTDSEEEEDELKRDYRGREAMLFVVDAALFADPEKFTEALQTIRMAFISGMIANDKELMGVVFTNTQHSPDPYDTKLMEVVSVPKNCAVFLPPMQLTKPIVQHYTRFVDAVLKEFPKQYGVGDPGSSFSATMRLCMDLLENCGHALNTARLIYMTDKETPHAPQSHEFQMALQRAEDLMNKDIEFHVIPMVDNFNYDVFYKEFITLAKDLELDNFIEPDSQQLRKNLADRKVKQDALKRCLGHFRFMIGADLSISAQYYNYYRRRSYPRKVNIMRKNNEVVSQKMTIVVRKLDPDTMECSEEHELKANEGWYEINLGSMPIRISPQQMIRVRTLHAPGMLLLGFKPLSELPDNLFYLPSNFMYPDDQALRGSKRLFRAMWECCLSRQKVAICLFNRKQKSIPRYVALVPVSAVDHQDTSFRSLLPGDGFNIVYLPMAKHVRNLDLSDWRCLKSTEPDENSALFEQVIKKLRIKYEPSLLNDPVLERLQADLLALALNIETDKDGLTGVPDAEMQEKRIAKLLPQVEEMFGADVAAAKKRAAVGEAAGNPPKMARISDDQLKKYAEVKQLIANNALNSCTALQLRFILAEHFGAKLPKTATKPVLIEHINKLSSNH